MIILNNNDDIVESCFSTPFVTHCVHQLGTYFLRQVTLK